MMLLYALGVLYAGLQMAGPIFFMFCPFYGDLCKIGPSNLQNDDYGP